MYAPAVVTAGPRLQKDANDLDGLYELVKEMTFVSSLSNFRRFSQPHSLAASDSRAEDLVELLHAMTPYLDLGSGLSAISHKKKAKFWRALMDVFPNFIDYLCSSKDIGQRGFIEGPDKFYFYYTSSEVDSERHEDAHPRIASTHYQWIRPQHRAAVACFLASTSSRNRQLFEAASEAACAEPTGLSTAAKQVRRLYALLSGAQPHFIPPGRNRHIEESIRRRQSIAPIFKDKARTVDAHFEPAEVQSDSPAPPIIADSLLHDTEDHKEWAAHERQAAAATAATQTADAAEMSTSASHWPDENRSPAALPPPPPPPPLASREAESDSRAVALLRHRQGLASQLQVGHPEEAAPSELVRVAETATAETVEGLPVILCLRYRPLRTPAICATILIRTHARAHDTCADLCAMV